MRDSITIVNQNGQLIALIQGSPVTLRQLIHQAIAHKLEEQFLEN